MITQKIAEIIEKNAQCVTTGTEIPGMLKYVNAVPVNTLIVELCKVLKVYSLFDPAEFTQTALGIKEREYRVFWHARSTRITSRCEEITAISKEKAIALAKSAYGHGDTYNWHVKEMKP